MEKLLKKLKGHSGSTVALLQSDDKMFVRKIENVQRNYERLSALLGYVDVPKIYNYDGTILDMEYIHGTDMKNYLLNNSTKELSDFLINTLSMFASKVVDKDYTNVYNEMLSWLEDGMFPFTKEELIDKLPKILPQSVYHGDMTLENIIHSTSGRFYFIDAVTLKYDSWVFDIAKLRQDLECKWFLRRDPVMLDGKLLKLQDNILKRYPIANDDYLLILMLLRVYLHCEKDTLEYNFIVKEINRLWK
jgi:RIO-like serine/threonine protein kinase